MQSSQLGSLGALALAQSKSANLYGVVKDPSEALIPGVTLTIRNLATNQTRETQSDGHGRYAFPDLDIGRHEITANLRGFKPTRFIVELSIGQNAELDLTLTPGEVSEKVEVNAGEQRLGVETRSSTFGQLVSRRQIENLPLNGRDYTQLVLLQPGTVQARSDQGDILTGTGPKVSVHGARTSQNA